MARPTALQLYRYLPAGNCGKCGEKTCMSFAIKLLEREKKVSDCTELTKENKERLTEILTPPVREVEIGAGENSIKIGGEEVMYRHEFKFFNPTGLFIDVSDLMSHDEIDRRIRTVNEFEIERVGHKLRLDGIAIRSASGDPDKFRDAVDRVAGDFAGPLILCSFDPDVIDSGIEILGERKPLIYAANEDNMGQLLKIAKDNNAPLAVYSQDLSSLGDLANEIHKRDFDKIVLDPGIKFNSGTASTLNKFTMLRKSAINGTREVGYPLMGSTVPIWMNSRDSVESTYHEATMAAMLIDRFSSLLIIHSMDVWSLLPLVILRRNIYTDPRIEPTVEAKLYEIGNPDENSPLLITTNFALTYFNVSDDLESESVSCYLLVIDTEGLGVTVSIAADKLTASIIKDSIEKNSVRERIKHSRIIIPGAAAKLKLDLENATGFEVMVGPQDSSQIPKFLKENWQ